MDILRSAIQRFTSKTSSTEEPTKDLEKFGTKLFIELAKTNPQKNIVFSPFSIQTCIAMLRLGAEGQTALEIDKCFGLTSLDLNGIAHFYHDLLLPYENSNILKIANKIYIMHKHDLNEKFNELLSKKFFSIADEIDFAASEQAANTMNTWIAAKTNNLIKNIISADMVNADTGLVLLNAIYFNGEWVNKFPKSHTHESDFYLDDTNSVKVQMMDVTADFGYCEFPKLNATALEMPYKDSDLSMLIILPKKRSGLSDLVRKLKSVSLQDLSKKINSQWVKVKMPKFKVEFEMVLNEHLEKLGMSSMFSNSAELGKILKSPDALNVSKIVHKTYIKVDEDGTEAAAASGSFGSIVSLPTMFNANHGFYYAIKSANFAILFEGKLANF